MISKLDLNAHTVDHIEEKKNNKHFVLTLFTNFSQSKFFFRLVEDRDIGNERKKIKNFGKVFDAARGPASGEVASHMQEGSGASRVVCATVCVCVCDHTVLTLQPCLSHHLALCVCVSMCSVP